jgi:type II secretory pathway pseudopilin PulG
MTGRDRVILILIAAAALLVAPYLLVISPKRDQATKLQGQVASLQSQLTTVRAEAVTAQASRAAFGTSYAALVRLGEAVPTDDNTPSLIYQLQSAASAAKVDFQSLTYNAGSGGSSPAASSTPASQSATAALPPGATVGPAGFPIEPFTFTFQGNFFHLADFLGRLQRFVQTGDQKLAVSGRLMTLNAISLGPAPSGFPQITATISASTYLLPASQGLLNGATPLGPAPASTQTVSTPSAGSSTAGAPAPTAVVGAPVR